VANEKTMAAKALLESAMKLLDAECSHAAAAYVSQALHAIPQSARNSDDEAGTQH
jgi:hypothetical protein